MGGQTVQTVGQWGRAEPPRSRRKNRRKQDDGSHKKRTVAPDDATVPLIDNTLPGQAAMVPATKLITVKAAAERLAVSDRLIYRMFKREKLRGIKIEGAVRIFAQSVEEYITAKTTGPAPAADGPPTPPPAPAVTPPRRRRSAGQASQFVHLRPQSRP
jgi:excisionase family DNA binding protein